MGQSIYGVDPAPFPWANNRNSLYIRSIYNRSYPNCRNTRKIGHLRGKSGDKAKESYV
jgi:hypothetical protein